MAETGVSRPPQEPEEARKSPPTPHGRAPPPRTAQRSVALPTPSVQPPSLQNLKTKTSVAGNPQFVVAMAATDTSHHTSVTGNLGDSNVCEEAPI